MDGWVTAQKEELRSDVLKLTLYELNTAISPRKLRINAIHAALSEFNHVDPSRHDQELDLHADKILLQKLSFCYAVRKYDEELGLLSCALEMVFRANRARVAISFHEVGESLLPLLVDMLRWSAARRKDILLTNGPAENDHDDETSLGKSFRNDNPFQQSDPSEFLNGNKSDPVMNGKSNGYLSFVAEEKKEKGDEYDEHPHDVKIEENASTACSSVPNDSPSDFGSTASMRTKRQVRFSDSLDVEISSDEKMINDIISNMSRKDFTNPVAVKKVIKILRYFSRVFTAMTPMAHFPGLLDELVFNLRIPKSVETLADTQDEDSGFFSTADSYLSYHSAFSKSSLGSEYADARSVYSMESNALQQNGTGGTRKPIVDSIGNTARIDAIATIVNLACAEENKSKLLKHPGLLDAVISVARDDPMIEAREHASIVLQNLALEDSNKVFMANNDELFHTVLTLLNDKIVNIRRYASSIMVSLACVSKNTVRMTSFCDGKILSRLALVLRNEQIEEIRVNVAECLFNCARYSTETETIELMAQHEDVLPTLSSSVLSDYSADVRAYTARTLEWLAADIHYDSTAHQRLLDALTEAAQWTKTNCIVEAFKAQASIGENRKALVEHRGTLDALATLASLHGANDYDVREGALMTIERLAHEPSTREIMAGHEAIMTELTRATFSTSGILDEYEEGDDKSRKLMKSALKYLVEAL